MTSCRYRTCLGWVDLSPPQNCLARCSTRRPRRSTSWLIKQPSKSEDPSCIVRFLTAVRSHKGISDADSADPPSRPFRWSERYRQPSLVTRTALFDSNGSPHPNDNVLDASFPIPLARPIPCPGHKHPQQLRVIIQHLLNGSR